MAVPDSALHLERSRTSSVVNGSDNERRSGSATTGNANGCYHVVTPKFKRRQVSAVRDFPPGCGRLAARLTSEPSGSGNDVGIIRTEEDAAKTLDALTGRCVGLKSENECQPTGLSPTGASQSLESTPESGQTVSVEDKIEKPGVVAREERVVSMAKELDSKGPVKPEKASKPKVNGVLLEMPRIDCSDAKKDVIQSDDSVACSASNFLKKTKTHRYPPRRRVSAVRDFPPLCGRNAPVLGKEEYARKTEASSLKGKDYGEEKPLENGEVKSNWETDAKKKKEIFQNRDSRTGEVGTESGVDGDEIQVEPGPLAMVSWRKDDELEGSPGVGMAEKDAERTYVGSSQENNENQVSLTEEITENRTGDYVDLEKPTGKEIVIYTDVKDAKRKRSDVLRAEERSLEENDESESERAIVLGVMALPNSPWKKWNRGNELSLKDGFTVSKGKKQRTKPKSASWKKKSEGEESSQCNSKKGLTFHEEPSNVGMDQLVVWEPEDSSDSEEQTDDFYVSVRPRPLSVYPPPFGHASSGGEVDNKTETVTRNKVRETLRLFQAVCRKLLQEEETKSKQENRRKRVDLQAAKILKDKGRYISSGKPIMGVVPGVEVGDEFQYRVELNIIGLHRAIQAGIDYLKCDDDRILATSIVSSGAYEDVLEHSDFLIYTGQGGNVVDKNKEPEDQKLEKGNLALSNSMLAKNPVRVIRGLKETRASDLSDSKHKTSVLYTYDGLYLVEKCWQEVGQHGKLVYKFRLNRIRGQPELAWKMVKKSKRYEDREGLCVRDISQGKEIRPIGAVNTIDDEKPQQFMYVTRVIYPDWCRRLPPRGCDCSDGCSDSEKCSCAVKNGGEIPYNYNGAIVEAKPLVYECGPSCKCPPSCHNRVSQRGIRLPLEIFKTELRGWGVRSLTSISSGSFICEYVGELLDDKQAEERAGNDEYLFDIGNNYNDNMYEELSSLIPDAHSVSPEVVEEVGFVIDAARYGNVGRFINHSCTPNLYAQNVLYDQDDKRIPHIMFFAAENIPPLQELTYHYNYLVDQVLDSDGNIKMKSCFCGSAECVGRMY
ncbi:histone-lysine N-methyltransferase, H3 lysine-9 specific SUVH6-like [Punica granatum]|uniref:Uncharacterized protein n=2 Tax=Punica granatum TaxID=22663 RepID=A0A218XU23_PUNGR|nr:histone-lysine N-methyltransferase, H3 lysine-9 specific SUVH6-like [Punica granatum]XP_031391371.1 histone-lysine N-methyltransferase, H3 lysine-9 specific SUVH6-like [Punica granatum]OWM88330.1 hypothetical protein CDL15_Pgr003742 [Punica granatum]PKI38121.1 hypothetical protein CRG98_041486 [Punica granatum]